MVAICALIKKPFNFNFWIDYHISIGIDHFFLRVEETPELESILSKYGDRIYVEYHNENFEKINNIYTLADRQLEFINLAVDLCLDRNIDWLFHVDCDELIWVKNDNVKNYLSSIPDDVDSVSITNYEAVYPNDNLENPFLQTNKFLGSNVKSQYTSYVNGKSVGRVTENLIVSGPHHFSLNKIDAPTNQILILHFESPTFQLWYEKFHNSCRGIIDKNYKNYNFYWNVSQDNKGGSYILNSNNYINNHSIEEARNYYNDVKVKPFYENKLLQTLYWTPQLPQKNSNWSR